MSYPLSKYDVLLKALNVPDVAEHVLKWDSPHVTYRNVISSLEDYKTTITNESLVYTSYAFYQSSLLGGESLLPIVAAPRGIDCYDIKGCNSCNANYIRMVRNWVLINLVEVYVLSLNNTEFIENLLERFTTPLTKKIVISQMSFIINYVQTISDSDSDDDD